MKCLVSGGAGFIGSHLVELLLAEGHDVLAIDNLRGGHVKNLAGCLHRSKFAFREQDIRDEKTLSGCFENIDWVFHLAGMADIVPSIENPREYFAVNVDGTFNMLEGALKAQVKRFVYAASSSCYGIPDVYPTPEEAPIQPQYPYALTKYLGEQLVMHWERVYHIPSLSLRLFNVYGSRARTTGGYGAVFGVFLAQKIHGEPFTIVGDGAQTRDFTYVSDVAKAFLAAAKSNLSGEIMNVGSGGHYSVNRLVQLLGGERIFIPKRPGEPDCTFADIGKIKKLLGWKPEVSFEEGVERLLSCLNDFRDAPLWNPKTIQEATASWFQCLAHNQTKNSHVSG